MTVRSLSKLSLACLAVCVGTSAAVAQKNPAKLAKGLPPKARPLQVAESVRPPFKMSNSLPSLSSVLQQNLLFSLDLAAQRQAAQQQLAPATAARKRALAAQRVEIPTFQSVSFKNEELNYITKQTAPVRQYLDTHDNTWPTYRADGSNDYILRRIRNFITVQDPQPVVLAIQQELIRMRAHSKARTPQEVRAITNGLLEYGVVPQQPSYVLRIDRTEDELALGEDVAFAVAAYKVPMEKNPWQIDGMGELADKVSTYDAMCRATPLFEGLPVTYEKDGVHFPNFPVWTQEEYDWNRILFVQEHPFEYVLAPYRERNFSTKLPAIYNALSDVEKQAIMFRAPLLADAGAEQTVTAQQYEDAVEQWMQNNHREPVCPISNNQQQFFGQLLLLHSSGNSHLFFRNALGEEVPFSSLPYDTQIETLMWAWRTHHLEPQVVLGVLYQ